MDEYHPLSRSLHFYIIIPMKFIYSEGSLKMKMVFSLMK